MANWQPIKTAPKDGTPILLYSPEVIATHYRQPFGDDHIVVGSWNVRSSWRGKGGWYSDVTGYISGAHGDYPEPEAEPEEIKPTHWMPLPEPPK